MSRPPIILDVAQGKKRDKFCFTLPSSGEEVVLSVPREIATEVSDHILRFMRNIFANCHHRGVCLVCSEEAVRGAINYVRKRAPQESPPQFAWIP